MNQTILLSGMGIYWFFVLIILLGTVPLIVYLQHRYKRCSMRCETYKQEIAQLKEELLKAKSWEALIPELRNIARLDHDVNTPLCVITMSLGRAKKLGQQSGDELLLNNVKDITDAVARI
ncbi:MAG: hypothetical protein M0Q18_01470, partial [Candidatus Cloacimonetes bacterium]|nr:hypothetical protein [Candidatus Cloacimonadota bacterium]